MPVANTVTSGGSKSSSAAPWPRWREHLSKIPKDDLCGSQKDLLRSMELFDAIACIFDENKPEPAPTVATPDAPFTIFLPCLEVQHRPIKDRSVFSLLSVELATKLAKFLLSSAIAMEDLATGPVAHNPLIKPSKSPVARAIHRLACAASLEVGHYDSCAPGTQSHYFIMEGLLTARQLLTNEKNTANNEKEMKRLQETYKTQLTLADLIEMSEVRYAELILKAAEVSATLSSENGLIVSNSELVDGAAVALEHFLSSVETSQEVSWYRCSKIYGTLGPTTQASNIQVTGTINRRIEKIFQRNLKAAEEEGDPLRQAWASFDLALAKVTDSGWSFTELNNLSERGFSHMAACKPWVPPYFRKILIEGADIIGKMLKGAEKMYPADYKTRKLGMEVIFGIDPSELDLFDLGDPNPRRRCSACDQESRTMSACSGCKKVYYCNTVCQKKHWKAGHKNICGK